MTDTDALVGPLPGGEEGPGEEPPMTDGPALTNRVFLRKPPSPRPAQPRYTRGIMADRIPTGFVVGPAVPTATRGSATEGAARTRYGRLANPDLAVTAGEWVSVQSTFLHAIRFVPYAQAEDDEPTPQDEVRGDLYLEFNSGFIGKWANRSYRDYRDYLSAPSKGVHHRKQPWYSDYETVRGPTHSGAALAARVKANG
jgi:hypothetical protein